jgi:hypothetical protein
VIEIAIETPEVMTGHFLTANVRWQSEKAGRILVAAEWASAAMNGTRRGVGRSIAHVPQRGEQSGSFPVRLLIPHEGPLSFSGEVLQIAWTLWARIERPGADEFAHVEFRVIPRRAA